MPRSNSDVFINCPFDDEYKPLFRAIHFTIVACGYAPRCALEDGNGFDIRLEKLKRIIHECERSVHDLSRVELNQGLPRFNMPFELGLTYGAKLFGNGSHKRKTALILVAQPYKMPAYLSDLAGNDPSPHQNDKLKIVMQVRRYLDTRPQGSPLPGQNAIHSSLAAFEKAIPNLAKSIKQGPEDVDAFEGYRHYASLVSSYLKFNPVV